MGRRACLIVLDAVGAGALPDAAAYGDAGSSTLQHVARGGRRARPSEHAGARARQRAPARGLPAARRRAVRRGRLREHSAGKDTTTGHWELMGVITEKAMPTYPDGFPDDVIDAFSEATGRGVIGNVAASGTEIIERLGEEHQRTGRVDRLHLRRLGVPGRRARADRAARGAVRGLPDRAPPAGRASTRSGA